MNSVEQLFKFDVGQHVVVDGVECVIKDREYYDGVPDYLVYALDGCSRIRGNDTANGVGWCYEDWIQSKDTKW